MKNPRRAEWGWTSNNSVYAELGMRYDNIVDRIVVNGEPGFAWLDNMRRYSRMGDPPDDKDARVEGGNPCLEQVSNIVSLPHRESGIFRVPIMLICLLWRCDIGYMSHATIKHCLPRTELGKLRVMLPR